MNFYSRRLIKPSELNPRNTLFGGILLQWIDEEAAVFAMAKLGNTNVATKLMSEINFTASAKVGEIIEIGLKLNKVGRTSISMFCEVRNILTKQTIISIDNIIIVCVDKTGKSAPHGKTLETLNP